MSYTLWQQEICPPTNKSGTSVVVRCPTYGKRRIQKAKQSARAAKHSSIRRQRKQEEREINGSFRPCTRARFHSCISRKHTSHTRLRSAVKPVGLWRYRKESAGAKRRGARREITSELYSVKATGPARAPVIGNQISPSRATTAEARAEEARFRI